MKRNRAYTMVFILSLFCLSVHTLPVSAVSMVGEVQMDGSSTIFPIMEAVAEEYTKQEPHVKLSIGISGTGGGFHRFGKGEVDITNASRPMKREEERLAKKHHITYTPFQIAYDGLTLIVNRENTWADNLTIEELQTIWSESETQKKWSQIHPKWPHETIQFYAPGIDSGTYDYFQSVVLQQKRITKTVTLSEDDNVLIRGVMSNKHAIAFVGYAYYAANRDKVKAVKINGISPAKETIQSGAYKPLSRPLYVYVNNSSIRAKNSVASYVSFMMKHAGELVEEIGYVKLPQYKYNEQLQMLTEMQK
ncbi:PstS family phosphate ABC transporter substrate-binding protein [Bacillus sp. WLY-B-L8]|uniref:PstS family phosphate ABC transporter substrate-binding protein n=1 Tax=Bacillus multifaciens TaxID=3068506 RepID=UPI0035326023